MTQSHRYLIVQAKYSEVIFIWVEYFTGAATRFVTWRASRITHFKTISHTHNSLLLLQFRYEQLSHFKTICCDNSLSLQQFRYEQHTSRLSVTTLFHCQSFVTNNTLHDYQSQLSFHVLLEFRHEQHTLRLSVTTLFHCYSFVTNNTFHDYQLRLSFIVTVSSRTTHFMTISYDSLLLLQFRYCYIKHPNWALDVHHQIQ